MLRWCGDGASLHLPRSRSSFCESTLKNHYFSTAIAQRVECRTHIFYRGYPEVGRSKLSCGFHYSICGVEAAGNIFGFQPKASGPIPLGCTGPENDPKLFISDNLAEWSNANDC